MKDEEMKAFAIAQIERLIEIERYKMPFFDNESRLNKLHDLLKYLEKELK